MFRLVLLRDAEARQLNGEANNPLKSINFARHSCLAHQQLGVWFNKGCLWELTGVQGGAVQCRGCPKHLRQPN